MYLAFFTFIALAGNAEGHWKTINIVNNCATSLWPALAPNAGHQVPAKGGFALAPGQTTRVVVPWTWQGRLWARTGCRFDDQGSGTCVTGDCAGKLQCEGHIGTPPATLAQFTFLPDGKPGYYDVSLVDGFNVPLSVRGGGDSDGCATAGCGVDVNRRCPRELRVDRQGAVMACKSACLAFDLDRFCCRNEYDSATTCPPNVYSRLFKEACPGAYSYAYDSPPPLFTCAAADFTVTFCPPQSRSETEDSTLTSYDDSLLLPV